MWCALYHPHSRMHITMNTISPVMSLELLGTMYFRQYLVPVRVITVQRALTPTLAYNPFRPILHRYPGPILPTELSSLGLPSSSIGLQYWEELYSPSNRDMSHAHKTVIEVSIERGRRGFRIRTRTSIHLDSEKGAGKSLEV
jgi:hypothetical protein